MPVVVRHRLQRKQSDLRAIAVSKHYVMLFDYRREARRRRCDIGPLQIGIRRLAAPE